MSDQLTEEERVVQINKNAVVYLQSWLEGLESGSVKEDDLLPSLYAAMIVAYLYGYAPDAMVVDAKAAAARLLAMVEKEEESSEKELTKEE
jgi:hypothetical protein